MLAATPTSSSSTTVLVLSEHDVFLIAIALVALSAVVIGLPLFLALTYRMRQSTPPPPVAAGETPPASPPSSFFQIPYITWFLVHYGVAALAIFAIVLLGIDNVIDKGTVSALLGSLFGYVLGSATRSSGPSDGQGSSGSTGAKPPAPIAS